MPGIFGLYRKRAPNRDANRALIDAMGRRLSHNPDYTLESLADDWFALGSVGLPLPGEKRFATRGGRAAAFSGYIYGFKDLPDELAAPTDAKAERLLALHDACGTDAPRKLDGCFDVAIFDGSAREGWLYNDRLGHRQLYLFEDDELLLFACEVKALLAYEGLERRVDVDAAACYFNYGYVLGDRTLVEGVRLLRGSRVLHLAPGGIDERAYWEFSFGSESRASADELIEEADEIYRGVLSRILAVGGTPLVPLSGGLDSRFICGQLVRAGVFPHAFSHGRRGCLDHRLGEQVARALGIGRYGLIETRPEWLIDSAERFVFLSDGMGGVHHGLLLSIGERYGLDPRKTSLLNGIFGGPGNFGSGYFRERDLGRELRHEAKLEDLRRSLFGDVVDEGFLGMFSDDFRRQMERSYRPVLDEEFRRYLVVSGDYAHQKDAFFIRNRLVRFMNQADANRFLWHDHFVLYDDRLIDFYARLPARLKLRRAFFYEYFKRLFPELARIPYQYTGASLYSKPSPLATWSRRALRTLGYKLERLSLGRINYFDPRNYHHLDQWFRTHSIVSSFFEDLLLDARTLERGYYSRDGIERILRWQHRGGRAFYLLSWLASFELFHRLHIESDPA